MDGDENDMIPVKDMSEKEKHTRSIYHEKDSSLVQERAGIAKLSREELEDRHLRLLEENQILKKHCHKQEDKIKRLATKLLRLVQDRKKTGEAAGRQRDPETVELIQSQQDQISQMERQVAHLKDKLLVARQQVNSSQGNRPGRPLAPKADTLRRPSSRPSSKTSSQKRQPAGGPQQQQPSTQQLPPFAEQLLMEAREAAARLQQQSAALAERNRELEETFSSLREQCNMYEQELEMLKEQSRVKDLEHDEELEALRNQASQANRSKLAENVEMIKLQRELKQTSSRLAALQAHSTTLEEALRTERPAYERAAREISELKRLHEEEQSGVQQLQREAAAAAMARQQLAEVETALRDAQRENELLRTANQKLSDLGSDADWQREQRDAAAQLRSQLASAESSLRSEQSRRRQLSDQLSAEQQRSWRLQAEARDLQSQLLRTMALGPYGAGMGGAGLGAGMGAGMGATQSQGQTAAAAAAMVEMARPRPEMRDKAVCTSPRRPEPTPRRDPTPAPEREREPTPAADPPPDSPTAELLRRIDTGEPLPRQLAALHCRLVETVQELEKTRTLLDVQKQINGGQRQELSLLTNRLAELGRERERAEAALRSALQARTGRVLQLEERLRELAYRRAPGERGAGRPGVLDASMQLEPGACLLELHVERLALSTAARAALGEAGVFLTWIFYNQDMHFTPVVHLSGTSGELRFACSSLYKVQLDRALVHYLSRDAVTIEVQRTDGGSDCRQLGSATVNCREILDYPRNRLHGTAEVEGLGTLEYWFRADAALEEYLQTRGAEEPVRDRERDVRDGERDVRDGESGERDGETSGAGDQTIVAGSPDICEPASVPKPRRGPAAVSTPVRRRLAARAAPASTHTSSARHTRRQSPHASRPSPRNGTVSDTEATESECSREERSPRRALASRARSEADVSRNAPRPAVRREPTSRATGGGGDASPPQRRAQGRAQQRQRETTSRETETPRRPPRKERRESVGGTVERRESGRGDLHRRESVRGDLHRQESVKERRESGRGEIHRRESFKAERERRESGEVERRDSGRAAKLQRRESVRGDTDRRTPARDTTDQQRRPEPNASGGTAARPAVSRLVQSGPAAAAAERPAPAQRGKQAPGQKAPAEHQAPPRPPPRTTGYATYTESSASEASSMEELGRPETPPRRRERPERPEREQRENKREQPEPEREKPQQKRQPVRGRQLQVGGSSPPDSASGGGGSGSDDERPAPAADRSPLTAGRSPPSSGRPRPSRRRRERDRDTHSPPTPDAWHGGGGGGGVGGGGGGGRGGGGGGGERDSPGGDGDGGEGSGSDRTPERTVVPANGRGLRVTADVHRRGSETSASGSTGTGTGTDSEGVVLHRTHVDTPAASDSVTITVHDVTLSPGADVYRRSGTTSAPGASGAAGGAGGAAGGATGERPRLFVEYRFLDVPPEELESPHSLPLPEPGEPLVFNFRKVIPVSGRQRGARRRLLAEQLSRSREGSTDQGVVTFTVVAEPEDSEDEEAECTDVGYAQLNLAEVLSTGREPSQSRLPLRTADGRPTGHLSVSLRALQALRAAAAAEQTSD